MTVNMPPHETSRTAPPAESADWRQHSACRTEDPDLWFPTGTTGPFVAQAEQAKSICNTRCPVVDECLRYALESRQLFGVWGGLDEEQRRRMLGVRRPRVRYGDGSVVAELLTERRAELDTLMGQGLTGGPLARALGTNTQTVNNVLRALEEEAQQAGPAAGSAAPDEEGSPEGAVVDLFLAGYPVAMSRPERIAALLEGLRRGLTYRDLDELGGTREGTAYRALLRARRAAEQRGESFPVELMPAVAKARLTEEEVIAIRERSAAGETDMDISLSVGLTRGSVAAIVTGATYQEFGGPRRPKRVRMAPREASRAVWLGSGEQGSIRRGAVSAAA